MGRTELVVIGVVVSSLCFATWKQHQIQRRGAEAVLFNEAQFLNSADKAECQRYFAGGSAGTPENVKRCVRLARFMN